MIPTLNSLALTKGNNLNFRCLAGSNYLGYQACLLKEMPCKCICLKHFKCFITDVYVPMETTNIPLEKWSKIAALLLSRTWEIAGCIQGKVATKLNMLLWFYTAELGTACKAM